MKIKVCGLRESENVKAIAAIQPQWLGFIFTPASPRYFLNAQKQADISAVPSGIKKVGVFVNEDETEILRIKNLYQLDYVQLHGDENVDVCKRLKEKDVAIIKAFRVRNEFDFSVVNTFAPFVDLFLFDTAGKSYGGNGIRFDWKLLKGKKFDRPFLLSGGIRLEDVELLKSFHHPDMAGIDVNSRFEIAAGLKDVEALKLFKQQIS